MSELELEVFEDAAELADTVARRALQVLEAAIHDRGEAHLLLTGGSILEKTMTAFAQPAALRWSRVHVWWGDERYVPENSDDRNDRPAMTVFLDNVPVEPARLHRMPAADAGFADAEAAAVAYAGELAAAAGASEPGPTAVPAFDVALLGVGPDGHCASLFPGHPGTRKLDASVIAVHDSPKPPPTRLSLSFPALDVARQIWFVVSGESKAEAVAQAVGGAPREEIPSAGPRGQDRTLWLVDRAAASKLES
jgi:6-phosphogluconolactonase